MGTYPSLDEAEPEMGRGEEIISGGLRKSPQYQVMKRFELQELTTGARET